MFRATQGEPRSAAHRARSVPLALAAVCVAALGGCATLDDRSSAPTHAATTPVIAPFSAADAGEPPAGWAPWTFARFKKETVYELVRQGDDTVLRASADGSASGLIHRVRFDPRRYPILTWRWRVPELIAGADNTRSSAEDSPVRIVVAFDDDPAKLPAMERVAFTQFRMLTQQTLPYATLMYIWENRAEPGTIIPSAHTSRIQMIVADSGAANVGRWREESRNIYEDYRRAFGTEPPPVKWIGVMTDADNTRSTARGYYGDIRISAR